MWEGGDQGNKVIPNEILKTTIVSNLNPKAKEFYPSYVKSWRMQQDQKQDDFKTKQKDIRTYEMLSPPPQNRCGMMGLMRGEIEAKYTITSCTQIYGKINASNLIASNKTPKLVIPNVNRNPAVLPSNNITAGAIRKPSCKSSTIKNDSESSLGNHSKQNSLTKVYNSRKQIPCTASESCQTKKNTITKSVLKSKFTSTTKSSTISATATTKDSMSIKSSSSSDKSYGKRFSTSGNSTKSSTYKLSDKSCTPTKNHTLKETLPKTPRSTVASNLRKTETQKVR